MQECIVKRVRVRNAAQPKLDRLRQRYLAHGPVTLEEVFAAAGLTPRERHVLLERLPRPDGVVQSHEQIAGDRVMRKPDGTAYTRQRVEQIEREARRKLGLPLSVAAAVHRAERAGR